MKKTALLLTLPCLAFPAFGQTDQQITAAYAGKKYITFNTENSLETGGCERSDFFEATLSKKETHGCDQASVESFRSVFVQDTDSGVWRVENRAYYYFLSDQDTSFVFF